MAYPISASVTANGGYDHKQKLFRIMSIPMGMFFGRNQLRSVGRLIGVGREHIHGTEQLGVSIHTHIE